MSKASGDQRYQEVADKANFPAMAKGRETYGNTSKNEVLFDTDVYIYIISEESISIYRIYMNIYIYRVIYIL